ncbi:MAG: 16S rRNA (cytidine(1402)-2'-O)-methyltransferase [Bacteroidia bacterium]|nr:16S rRNA (cytidine(1402)-2'-O)-methyltransferase [Bacteroidia bacterium]
MARISLVPTPVGNLEDMSFRAVRILREADLIAAEDTRTSGILLKHYEIDTPKLSLHQHNEHSKVPQLLDRLEAEDLHLALISDAGTPGISDPGFLLVREAVARGITVETLPGPTAFVPALVSSGIPCDRFVFEGFLPVKKGRQTRFKSLEEESRTMVFYESPHRIEKTIRQMAEYFGEERQACISREISKLHEEHLRGSLAELAEILSKRSLKGEIVIVLAGKS